ncbi:MAG: hypothetical protein F4X55_02880 [Candidatus Dadabacteria bacterium]|nr:hypothetical protein [Candidatus Dadabacteria bacterium]
MQNQCFKRDIFGDKDTQKMAWKALPILITYAQKGDPIRMSDLVREIAPHLTRFNFAMKWVLAWIQTTLYKLEERNDWTYKKIPCITAIVLAAPETPTNWARKESQNCPWQEYESKYLLPVFCYEHWDKVRDFLFD